MFTQVLIVRFTGIIIIPKLRDISFDRVVMYRNGLYYGRVYRMVIHRHAWSCIV